jgi:hypothetical protein
MYDALKTCHKTEVSNLKSTWKNKEKELRDMHQRAELVSKSMDLRQIKIKVGQMERNKTSDVIATKKLQASLIKDRASSSEVKGLYVESCCKQ